MKKIISLIKACMTSDMAIFKFKKTKNKKASIFLPLFIAFYFMFMLWSLANSTFEELAPYNIAYLLLPIFLLGISFMTFIEGIYKSSSLIFNCKDDQLLLSLPIKKEVVIFIRIFKFYVFELIFNTMMLFPFMLAYIRWAPTLSWTYGLTCLIILLFSPIIPIILSCIVGMITASIASRFKYKNVAQIIVSMIVLAGTFYISFNLDGAFDYLAQNATSLNDLITKVYYPSGVFAKLVTDFNILDLLVFIGINILLVSVFVWIFSKFYFKINSRMKSVTTTTHSKIKVKELNIKKNSKTMAMIKKEINTFFKTPVFIINAGFSLVLFLIVAVVIVFKYDSFIQTLVSEETGLGLTTEIIENNLSIMILYLLTFVSFLTSITNAVISIEGKNISILKSLPIQAKNILLSKVLSAFIITTPVLLLGDFILFIRLKTSLLEAILLVIISLTMPLVSHFIGIIINLKYPKLDWENESEVVKQSASSFIAVMIGMVLMMIIMIVVSNVVEIVNTLWILWIVAIALILLDTILYFYLITKGVKMFNDLSI